MVAKTVAPGGSPPSTTAGSTGETVLNETAFDASEIFETVNPIGPEPRQARARIGGMTCGHCSAQVEQALAAVAGGTTWIRESAEVSTEGATASAAVPCSMWCGKAVKAVR